MQTPVYSVSALVGVLNQTLEYAYPSVVVEGEVASFKISKSKYVFFDLKDDESILSCFLMVYSLRLPLEDGMKVRLIAQPRITAWGKFSLNVREVLPIGEGSIKRAFDLLKTKLQGEGLFDASRKRTLPIIPGRVSVIASTESAGYADFIKILNHRWQGLNLEVADVQVQGIGAADQIMAAIDFFNQQSKLADALVIIRGGGSREDLAVFNEEPLVRALSASRIPTLVGIGHEVDTSLCDLVADVRAATPSNAAQLLVPDKEATLNEIQHKEKRLIQQIDLGIKAKKLVLKNSADKMMASVERVIDQKNRHLQQTTRLLKQLNPKAVLGRGYALVRLSDRLVFGSALGVSPGDKLTIELEHAIINAGVKDVQRKKS